MHRGGRPPTTGTGLITTRSESYLRRGPATLKHFRNNISGNNAGWKRAMATYTARPFLKWAGGKAQLLDAFTRRVPRELNEGTLSVFVEPFVGGGAVYFHFNSTFRFKECHIFDINEELILTYSVVKNDVCALIDHLAGISDDYLAKDDAGRKDFYYAMRNAFNRTKGDIDFGKYGETWIERASTLIFLNRTCFNGLYRVNSQGGFNVPFGRCKNPTILHENVLRADAELLQNTTIHHGDFAQSEPCISEETFIYLDPPYRPLNRTSSFTQYAKGGFTDEEQRRLAAYYARCDARGARLMLSNSDPKNIDPCDEFFDDLYAGYCIDRVPARRMINCNGDGRGEIREIIVTNYDPHAPGE
ncbi:Modification methylase DpnIIA [anaerobic digester metagenome]